MTTTLTTKDLKGDTALKHCKGGEYILIQRISYKGDPHWLYARLSHSPNLKEFPLTLDGRLTSLHFDFFLRPESMFTETHDKLNVPRFSMMPRQMYTGNELYRSFILSEFYKNLRNWWFTAVHTETGDKVKVCGDGTYDMIQDGEIEGDLK